MDAGIVLFLVMWPIDLRQLARLGRDLDDDRFRRRMRRRLGQTIGCRLEDGIGEPDRQSARCCRRMHGLVLPSHRDACWSR